MMMKDQLCALMLAGTLALGGCAETTTTTVRAADLPQLSESNARHPNGWHDTTDADGKRVTLQGSITSIAVYDKGPPPQRRVFGPRFVAQRTDDRLSMRDNHHESSYSLANVDHVDVTYSNSRRNAGSTLIAVGIPHLLLGSAPLIYGIVTIAAAGNETLFRNVGGLLVGVGVGIVGVGVALIVPGAMFFQDPRK